MFRSEQVHTCLDSTYASLPKLPTNKAKKADVKKTVPDHLEKVENEICINLGVNYQSILGLIRFPEVRFHTLFEGMYMTNDDISDLIITDQCGTYLRGV